MRKCYSLGRALALLPVVFLLLRNPSRNLKQLANETTTIQIRGGATEQQSNLTTKQEQSEYHNYMDEVPVLKLPTPVIVLSLPKSGTTSLYHFFLGNGIPTSHYCCRPGAINHPPCSPPELYKENDKESREKRRHHVCGRCVKRNIKNGVAPLKGCGDDYFQVYAQLDQEMSQDGDSASIYLPQVVALQEIHKHYPNATFVLGTRSPSKWKNSVKNWFYLRHCFRNVHLPEYDYPRGVLDLPRFYRNHTQRVREFVALHPSHTLVEINIEDSRAGQILADAFGLNSSAWGQSNSRKERLEKRNKEQAF